MFSSTTFASRVLRIIGAALLALAVAGCSALKLGYATAPELGYWWLDRQLDFNDTQAAQVREELSRLQVWHRGAELPRYVALLQSVQQIVPGEITPAQACGVWEQARARVAAVAEQAEAPAAALALTVTPAQLEHMQTRWRRADETFRKEWIDAGPAERLERRHKQLTERTERIYGRLEEAQRALLRERLQQSIFDGRRILAERQRRQADMLATLRKLQAPGVGAEQARALVRGLFERMQRSPDPAWQPYARALTQETCATVAALHNAASPAQRQAAAQRLRDWQRELGELVAAR